METDFRRLTSIRVESGSCDLLSFHLDRLQADADALGFKLDRERLGHSLAESAAKWPYSQAGQLRVQVRSDGTWEIEKPTTVPSEVEPLRALLWPEPVSSRDALLHHRTTPRSVYDLAYEAARKHGFVDVIFQNEAGLVTEGAIHNVVIRRETGWKTPPLAAGVLPGVFRRYLLETRPELREEDTSIADLFAAEDVFLTSAVHGLRKVTLESESGELTQSL